MKAKFLNIDWKLFSSIFVLLLLFDAIYISLFSNFFNKLFKSVQGGRALSIKYSAFVMTYVFMESIIYYFCFVKGFTLSDMFLLGISIYGVYELTNYYVTGLEFEMVIIDTLWEVYSFLSTAFAAKKLN